MIRRATRNVFRGIRCALGRHCWYINPSVKVQTTLHDVYASPRRCHHCDAMELPPPCRDGDGIRGCFIEPAHWGPCVLVDDFGNMTEVREAIAYALERAGGK